jgi:SAM-dependent methyltransferase
MAGVADDAVRLNIGAGHTYLPGFANIDIHPRADITLDLNVDRLPFEDSSVDLVFSYHTLEHVSEYLHAIGEIHRVLRHDGVLLLGVPYVTLSEYNLVNPYHATRGFSEHSCDFFDSEKLRGSAIEDTSVHFTQLFCRYHYLGRFARLPPVLRRWCRRHLFNVVRAIDLCWVCRKDGSAVDRSDARRARMLAAFDECLAGRRQYDA